MSGHGGSAVILTISLMKCHKKLPHLEGRHPGGPWQLHCYKTIYIYIN